MVPVIEHFDALTKQGLKVIPLRENSKVPMCKGWNYNWDRSACRERLEVFPDSNIGVLLGDVVDVEGDSRPANQQILDLIGDYPHPTYTSTKSIHHLFLSPDKGLRLLRVGDIEFRGYGHQSMLPPSQHQGTQYMWLRKVQFPVPPMPQSLYIFYLKQKKQYEKLRKPGHMQVWCSQCEKKCFLHKRRFELELEAFQLLGCRWECQSCRTVDLRPACRLIKRGIRGRVVLDSLAQF